MCIRDSENTHQVVAGIHIYPRDYFNPLNDNTGRLELTERTRSIHWYSKTWLSKQDQVRNRITRVIHRVFGENSLAWLRRLIYN